MVFVSLVVCAVSVSVARKESETHAFGPVTGHEKRFWMTRGWL